MQNLENILKLKLPKFTDFTLDSLQNNIFNNLYIELMLEDEKYLVSPTFEINNLSDSDAKKYEAEILAFILKNKKTIEKLKKYLILNLSVYSDLLESNSYLITINRYLVIARFKPIEKKEYDYEVQLYTIGSNDLISKNKDKIYIGRDFISLKQFKREFFGVEIILNSIFNEYLHLKEKFEEFKDKLDSDSSTYMQDIHESVEELRENFKTISKEIPAFIEFTKKKINLLVEANRHFRNIKHQLQDVADTVNDWERDLYSRKQIHFARYVTKFQKDIKVDINFVNAKVNSRITDYINNAHF